MPKAIASCIPFATWGASNWGLIRLLADGQSRLQTCQVGLMVQVIGKRYIDK